MTNSINTSVLRARQPSLERFEAERNRRALERERQGLSGNTDQVKANCKRLVGFIREAWHILEPNNPYTHGWHIDAISEHLEAISLGQITRLVINEPPGCMKSLIASVMWECWEWGPFGRPELRYLTTSYQEGYAKRDARRMRDLVSSEWYQALWPIRLIRAGETSFENTARGGREAKPFASLTAGRGNRVVIDDPHSTEMAESDADRERSTRIFRESVTSRLNNPKSDAILVIMHRLHSNDLCGVIDRLGLDYVKLILPMEFEADRKCVTHFGGKTFQDPRTYDGELLFPERFTAEVIDRDKKATTAYAWAGQYQQRPAPREGGMFKRQWFEGKIIKVAPQGTIYARHWDLAATAKKTAARTAGVKIGRMPDGRFVVAHVVKTQEEGNSVRKLIKATAETDGRECQISLPQDPGQAGKVQAADMIAMLAGFTARAEPETGDKTTRAEPFAAQCEAGNVSLVEGEWNEAYLDELANFPAGHFKDQVDASSGAFARLVRGRSPQPVFGTYGQH